MRRSPRTLAGILAGAVALVLVGVSPSVAQTAHEKVVREKPAWGTPDVLDGQVLAIAKLGDTVVLGGNFTEVSPQGSDKVYERRNIVAFDASDGSISTTFVPGIDGTVQALEPAPGGDAVYVGGSFNNVNGARSKSLALLDISSGEQVSTFDVPNIWARVFDLELSGGRLYLGGAFSYIQGEHNGIAALDATTGRVDDFMDVQFTGTHLGNYSRVENFAISPDGSRLVAIGNFTEASGEPRHQIAMLDLTGDSAEVASWRTTRYSAACSESFSTYMRDVDFAPSGEYFVVVTTGAAHEGTLCDTAARWEAGATGGDLQPTWASYTGGDTLLSVAVTGTAVYVGGHQRWHNNPYGSDDPGLGAVPRPGIAALDPLNGLPLSWNAMREPRGAGASALLATEKGLWVGSDTDYFGWYRYPRKRIAFLPLAGGERPVQPDTTELPANAYLAGHNDQDALVYRSYDGSLVGSVSGSGQSSQMLVLVSLIGSMSTGPMFFSVPLACTTPGAENFS